MRLLALVLAFGTAACATANPVGVFEPDAFHHSVHPYRVAYASGTSPLGSDWILENFRVGSDGAYDQPKSGPDYQRELRVDLNGDGEQDAVGNVYRYDLLFRHRRTAAQIWMSSLVLSQGDEETDLRVLMDRYVEAVSGAGSVTVAVDDAGARVEATERRYATRITDGRYRTVGGREAYEATVEVANVDQLHLSPDARWERAHVVLVRPHFGWLPLVQGGFYYDRSRPQDAIWPVILVLGYTSRPADYDANLPDFQELVGRIEFSNSPDGPLRDATLACDPGAEVVRVPLVVSESGSVLNVLRSDDPVTDCLEEVHEDEQHRATGMLRLVVHSYTRRPVPPATDSEPPAPDEPAPSDAPADPASEEPGDDSSEQDAPTPPASPPETAAAGDSEPVEH